MTRNWLAVVVLPSVVMMMFAAGVKCLRLSSSFPWRSSTRIGTATSTRLFASGIASLDQQQQLLGERYDVIVVGGGHAGCEAATAAARVGAKTALVTQKLETIGELSCNPSIGGIGKGHLVREVDALGGVMGQVADAAGIHYKMLNRRKGPAVRGPRAQMDRDLYKLEMQRLMGDYPNLSLIEASVEDLLLDERSPVISSVREEDQRHQAQIQGVVVTTNDGKSHEITGTSVIVTTGTFLRGVLMMGHERYSGGRHLRDSEDVEAPSVGLAKTLERFEFPLGRLKTGTPPRLDGTTIDWDILPPQPTEYPAVPFSYMLQCRGEQPHNIEAGRVIICRQSKTNDKTHDLVLKYEHLLPRYDGMDGEGNGPRYCPSIYKKVQRFPDRNSHNCFLEPEGLNTDIVYPNGMSGPYPPEKQLEIMRTMTGLEKVEIIRPGYDVEYDFVNPQSLTHTLETKKIMGLYLAGQICGTTGYEEAAAQGIVAGANAAKTAIGGRKESPIIIGRDEGYIGVLVDDLVTRGTTEPYRMFTSRAEYRISLRADNADFRLTQKGYDFGLVNSEERMAAFEARQFLVQDRIEKFKKFSLLVTDWANRGDEELMGGAQMNSKKKGERKSATQVLQMPHVTLKQIDDIIGQVYLEKESEESTSGDGGTVPFSATDPAVYDTVEASIKYSAYTERQVQDMESWRRAHGARIPPNLEYSRDFLPSLSAEELEKLAVVRPATFAEASQISGITPTALVHLYNYIMQRQQTQKRPIRQAPSENRREERIQSQS